MGLVKVGHTVLDGHESWHMVGLPASRQFAGVVEDFLYSVAYTKPGKLDTPNLTPASSVIVCYIHRRKG